MSKIDHADDAVDHGVADRDQAVDHAERNAVDQLLQGVGQSRINSSAYCNATMRNAYGARAVGQVGVEARDPSTGGNLRLVNA